MARGDWIKSGGRWCHRADVTPSARELRRGPPRRRPVGATEEATRKASSCALLTVRSRHAVADALEGLRLSPVERRTAEEWAIRFRTGDWARVAPWMLAQETELIYRACLVAMAQASTAERPSLAALSALFVPYRFDEDRGTS